jgi:hypothetical protein
MTTNKVREIVLNCGNGQIIAAIVNDKIGTAMFTGPDAVAAFQEMVDLSTRPNVLNHLKAKR